MSFRRTVALIGYVCGLIACFYITYDEEASPFGYVLVVTITLINAANFVWRTAPKETA